VRSACCGSVVRQTWGSSVEYRLAKIQKYKSKFRTMAAGVFHRLPHYQGGHHGEEKSPQLQSAIPCTAAVRQVPEEAHESRRR